ncbi:MAG: hypothetical protein AAGL17_18260, partial [Cyanobacteria bacterium J06576_12]
LAKYLSLMLWQEIDDSDIDANETRWMDFDHHLPHLDDVSLSLGFRSCDCLRCRNIMYDQRDLDTDIKA